MQAPRTEARVEIRLTDADGAPVAGEVCPLPSLAPPTHAPTHCIHPTHAPAPPTHAHDAPANTPRQRISGDLTLTLTLTLTR